MDNRHSSSAVVHFDPSRVLHFIMLGVMVGAVSWSISSFITPWIAVPIGTALTFAFANRAKVALGIYPAKSRGSRIVAGVTAWLLFCLTAGLSYGAVYKNVFAETSALRQLQEVRAPAQRQLEMVLADAVAARSAFDAWAKDSRAKAAQEGRKAEGGGTCPAKPQTGGTRGPIALWRDAEAGMASKLNADLDRGIKALEARVQGISSVRPVDYKAATDVMTHLNEAIAVSESVTHGSAIRAALDTLDRQLGSTITWLDGKKFDCLDMARTDLMLTAQKSLRALANQPAMKPVEPAIDLTNRQEVATRGLLRSFNAGAKLATFGFVGSFADDELMVKALLQNGLINRETLGLGLSTLLEVTVILTGAIAARAGGSPLQMDPVRGFKEWEARAEHATGRFGVAHKVTLPLAKAGFNLLFRSADDGNRAYTSGVDEPLARPAFKTSRHPVVELEVDPEVPVRELGWAKELLPWLYAWNDKDFVVVPGDRAPKASLAARALEYNNAAVLVGTDIPWEVVARHRAAARRLLRLLPDARTSRFEVYELAPPFAQALRINLLGPSGHA